MAKSTRQTIATAPRDGRLLDVWIFVDDITRLRLRLTGVKWLQGIWVQRMPDGDWWGVEDRPGRITHWRLARALH